MRHRSYLIPFAAGVVVGLAVAFLLPASIDGFTRAVCGYDAGAFVLLLLEWTFFMHRDAAATQAHAVVEDPGRALVSGVVLLSAAAGLAAAVGILGRDAHGSTRIVADGLALSAVLLGWVTIHTAFIYRYARLYYRDRDGRSGPDRGLQFPGDEPPTDYDFAYFSFVIGMTFQVSDVQITSARIRRLALTHALISFAYNASIFAFTVNVLAGLLQKK